MTLGKEDLIEYLDERISFYKNHEDETALEFWQDVKNTCIEQWKFEKIWGKQENV